MNLQAHSPRVRTLAASFAILASLLLAVAAHAAEVIPKAPTAYFNDSAGLVPSTAAAGFNDTLEDFEKETSSQILVVVYPTMQTDSSLEDYTHRIAASWKVGQKGKNNGAILFVFVAEHKSRIDVGAGLEGVLTDARCKDIVSDVIAPKFKAGDYEGGLRDGIAAILKSAKGEYTGGGRTSYERQHTSILDAGHGWTVDRILDLLLFGGIGLFLLLIVVFLVYVVWTTFIHPPKPEKHHRSSIPPKQRDHTVYSGRSSSSSSSPSLADARLVGSAVGGLLSLGSSRSVAGGLFAAAGGLFLGGGASGDW